MDDIIKLHVAFIKHDPIGFSTFNIYIYIYGLVEILKKGMKFFPLAYVTTIENRFLVTAHLRQPLVTIDFQW